MSDQQPETAEVTIEADVFRDRLWVGAESLAAKLLSMADVYEDAGWELLAYGGITPASVCREMGTQFATLAKMAVHDGGEVTP